MAAREEPKRILDLPCGHGRVLRMLKAAFPKAELTACDLERDGVDFCACTFGATPVYSTPDFSDIQLPGTFDLIWVGSLFTHLQLEGWAALMRLLMPALEREGLLVFTTHGRISTKRMRTGFHYWLDPKDIPQMLDEYEREGFAYRDFPRVEGYGISLSSPAWVMKEILRHGSLTVLSYTEAGWAAHQDVVVCQYSSDAAWLNPEARAGLEASRTPSPGSPITADQDRDALPDHKDSTGEQGTR